MATSAGWRPRDLQVLRLLGEGLSDREIASRLRLKPETVRWYNKRIYERLGVSSRIQAVRAAIAAGLLATEVAPLAAAPVARTPVRYVRRDGVALAYTVIGDGPVNLVFIPSFTSHIEAMLSLPESLAFFERLGRFARVFLPDLRGTGLSDRVDSPPALHETVEDLRAMLAAEGAEKTFMLGSSAGGAVSILLASSHPELVEGLILFGAIATTVRDGEEPTWARTREAFEARKERLVAGWGGTVAVEMYAPSREADPEFRDWWGRYLRSASSPGDVRRLLSALGELDVRPLLPHVGVRTLVIHRAEDAVVPVEAGRYLAAEIPHAQWLELPGADHLIWVDHETIAEAVRDFIERPVRPTVPDAWVAVLLHGGGRRLDAETRRVLDGASAQRVHALPEGWLAVFDSPARALRAARELRALGRGRVGTLALHVGACDRRTDLPLPASLDALLALANGARVADVRVSATLRDLMPDPEQQFVPVEADADTPRHWRLRD
jgi:pimeloyl-ACP methyl ester carboxylesterase/DNA-binding CsgD family transcriptional regulator